MLEEKMRIKTFFQITTSSILVQIMTIFMLKCNFVYIVSLKYGAIYEYL